MMRSRMLNAEQFEEARQILRDIDSLDSHSDLPVRQDQLPDERDGRLHQHQPEQDHQDLLGRERGAAAADADRQHLRHELQGHARSSTGARLSARDRRSWSPRSRRRSSTSAARAGCGSAQRLRQRPLMRAPALDGHGRRAFGSASALHTARADSRPSSCKPRPVQAPQYQVSARPCKRGQALLRGERAAVEDRVRVVELALHRAPTPAPG